MTTMLAIEAKAISKCYHMGAGTIDALHEVSFNVRQGDIVAVMGPSGCGKTTLLNCLSGLDTIDSGEVRIGGEDLHRLSDKKRTSLRARKMGFVFQFNNLIPVLTAAENVELPLLFLGQSKQAAREKALIILEKVGLKDRARHTPAELSGGQRQRVAIARALINDPVIVWADEPTGDLDEASAFAVMELFSEINQSLGQTMVMVTHNPLLAERARSVVHMQGGKMIPAAHQSTAR